MVILGVGSSCRKGRRVTPSIMGFLMTDCSQEGSWLLTAPPARPSSTPIEN